MARIISRIDADTFKINIRLKWQPPADYLPGEPLTKRVYEYLHDQIAEWRASEPDNPLVWDESKEFSPADTWENWGLIPEEARNKIPQKMKRPIPSMATTLLAQALAAKNQAAKGKSVEWLLLDIGSRVVELNCAEVLRKQMMLEKKQIEGHEKNELNKKKNAEWRRDEFRRLMDEYDIHNEEAPRILAKLGNSAGFEKLAEDLPKSKRRKLDIIRAAKKNEIP